MVMRLKTDTTWSNHHLVNDGITPVHFALDDLPPALSLRITANREHSLISKKHRMSTTTRNWMENNKGFLFGIFFSIKKRKKPRE